jgi:asparagine synthetase B (glutamine-hydrolysing)
MISGIITTNSHHQPFVHYEKPPTNYGRILFTWNGLTYEMSEIKATELKMELEHAIKLYNEERGK